MLDSCTQRDWEHLEGGGAQELKGTCAIQYILSGLGHTLVKEGCSVGL